MPRTAALPAPSDVVWIARTLEDAGYSAWAVGGAVRDALRGERPEDWDLTTSARPGDVRRLFRRTVPIGIAYGTVGVIARSGKMYEVTTFRRDVETFGRKARVVFSDSLDEDLARRDFTINAVAWHPITGEVRDPHGGMRDLEAGTLRTVGDPEQRFEEDRLRVLRALRFAGQFDLEIEPHTWRAAVAAAGDLGHLSAERIRDELQKVLEGQRRASRTLELYAQSGVLASLYPELDACRGVPSGAGTADVWGLAIRAVDEISRRRPRLRLAALLHAVGRCAGSAPAAGEAREADARGVESSEPLRSAGLARSILQRLRSSNEEIDTVTHLIAQLTPPPSTTDPDPEVRRWMRRVGREHLNDLFRLWIAIARAAEWEERRCRELRALWSRVRRILRSSAPLTIADLDVSGADLRALGIPPGPLYGEILRDLLERVTDDPSLNERERLLAIVERGLGQRSGNGGGREEDLWSGERD